MGITLDDVQCLLHISIQGKFLNHVKISRPDGAQMLSTYLGIDEGDALDMFATLKGPYLTHSYVKGLVNEYLDAAETTFANNAPMHEVRMYRERCVRDFLLFVVGCTIFSKKLCTTSTLFIYSTLRTCQVSMNGIGVLLPLFIYKIIWTTHLKLKRPSWLATCHYSRYK